MTRAVLLLLCVMSAPLMAADYVWWEGEAPVESNFPKRSDFSPATFPDRKHLLSGGDWLSSSGPRGKDEIFARYRIRVETPGRYNLWTRKFWKHGPFRWRFDNGDWRTCGRDVALADETYLRQFVGAYWVHLGEIDLPPGEHTFELRLLAGEGEQTAACFDCFILIRGAFVPNGALKPGEKSGQADEGFFAFEPDVDDFAPTLIDLRHLNERIAGERGFVRARGNDLRLGNGRAVRFWGVNVVPNHVELDRASIDYLARKLAKMGVNLVRFHGNLTGDFNRPFGEAERRRLDGVHYLVDAMKQQGIYTKLSFYFPLWHKAGDEAKQRFGQIYFDPEFQKAYRERARLILTSPNPYTGKTLATDPAVAIVEIVNEDSLFFWTLKPETAPKWELLERRFAQWLIARYGSTAKAYDAWGRREAGDADDRTAVYPAWHMTAEGFRSQGAAKRRRVADQVRFLAELQRNFYAETAKYFREELKVGGVISASNWITADAGTLEAIEHWTYTATDMLDRHGYFGGRHEGEATGYDIRVGDRFDSKPAVLHPAGLPIVVPQVEGFPCMISELGWTQPNRFRADATFLASAYGAMQGVDAMCWFTIGSPYLTDRRIGKFAVSSPAIAWTFPAAALMYRRGDVAESKPAVLEMLQIEDLLSLRGSAVFTPPAMDELRARQAGRQAEAVHRIDPLAAYVGRLTRSFERRGSGHRVEISKYVDRQKQTIRNLDGTLRWDYGQGVVSVHTPRAQGAAGFLGKAGAIRLGDVTISSGNDFAQVLIVSLDDQPLATSRRMLVQTMTEERPLGFRMDGDRIADLGGWPFGVRKVDVRVEMRNVGRVTPLDPTGKPLQAAVERDGNAIRLHPGAIYHLIER
jgi:hypothetical protein